MNLEQLSDDLNEVSTKYARNNSIDRDSNWFLLKLHEEVGELTQAYLMKTDQARAKRLSQEEREANFHAEVADALAHVLLLARHHNVDLPTAIEAKWLSWNR